MNIVYDSDIATDARSHLLDAMLLGETGISILFSAPFYLFYSFLSHNIARSFG